MARNKDRINFATIPVEAADWMSRANCNGVAGIMVDALPGEESKEWTEAREAIAKAICDKCAVKVKCLVYAYEHREKGVWGGTTTKERAKVLRRRAER